MIPYHIADKTKPKIFAKRMRSPMHERMGSMGASGSLGPMHAATSVPNKQLKLTGMQTPSQIPKHRDLPLFLRARTVATSNRRGPVSIGCMYCFCTRCCSCCLDTHCVAGSVLKAAKAEPKASRTEPLPVQGGHTVLTEGSPRFTAAGIHNTCAFL